MLGLRLTVSKETSFLIQDKEAGSDDGVEVTADAADAEGSAIWDMMLLLEL
jgi:hypothetical protein